MGDLRGGTTVAGNRVWHTGNFNPSNYLPVGSGGTVSGATTITSLLTLKGQADVGVGTVLANDVALSIEHNSGGSSTVYFKSGIAPANDFGYIRYQDSSTGTGELSRLTIGVENDNTGASADQLMLKAYTIINSATSLGAPTDIVEFQSAGVYKAKIDNTGNFLTGGAVDAVGGVKVNGTIMLGTDAKIDYGLLKNTPSFTNVAIAATAPATPANGDLWIDTTT